MNNLDNDSLEADWFRTLHQLIEASETGELEFKPLGMVSDKTLMHLEFLINVELRGRGELEVEGNR